MDTKPPTTHWSFVTALGLTIGVFIVDLRTPVGLAVPIFYIVPVLVSLWSPRRNHTVVVAYASIALTVLAYIYSPPSLEPRMEAANRLIGLLTVLAGAALGLLRREEESKQHAAYEALETRLKESNTELIQANKTLKAEVTERKAVEEALRQLSNHLLHLQDDERRRIARELHDTTAQSLAAIAVNLVRVEKLSQGIPTKATALIADSAALADQCSREIRTLSYLLHPPMLEEAGLSAALSWYANGFSQRSGVQVTVDVPAMERLANDLEMTLFRIVQESLTNISRHSGSKTASIRIQRNRGEVLLEIKDEGKGIPPEKLERVNGNVFGLGVGVAGIWERVRQLGGDLEINSNSRGTIVSVVLPLPEETS